VDPAEEEARRKQEEKRLQDEEMERVKKEYWEKQKKKSEKEKKGDKDKKDDKEKKEKEEKKNESSPGSDTVAPEAVEAIFPRRYALQRQFYELRVQKYKGRLEAQRRQRLLNNPKAFPKVPSNTPHNASSTT